MKIMIEQFKIAYIQQRRVRVFVCFGLFAYAVLLYSLSGGFPPWAWRFLLHTLPQLSRLWAIQGSAIVIPLLGLILLSLSLLILWAILLVTALKVALYWWYNFHHRQTFEQDLQDAERIADLAVGSQTFNTTQRQPEFVHNWQPDPLLQPTQSVPSHDPGTQPVRARGTVRTRSAYDSVRASSSRDTVGTQPARVGQPTEQSSQQPYAVARASRVVGSSGLISGPGAALSSDSPTMPPPTAQQGVERQTSSLSGLEPAVSCPSPQQRISAPAQPTQPIPRPSVQLAASSAAPRSSVSMREQLRIVPRQGEESAPVGYDVLPAFPVEPFIKYDTPHDDESAQDITTHDTLPGTDNEPERETEEAFSGKDTPVDPLRLLVGIGLDPGIARKDAPNEDTLFAIQGMRPTSAGPQPTGLFIVADGMGGHARGQEASKLAVHALSDTVVPTLLQPVDNDETFSDLLKDGVHRANLALYRRNREQEHMMGTTLTAALVIATTAYVVNVGDSRTYLYRPSEGLRQITRDHSVVARLVEDGIISSNDVYTHPRRNQIYRCLGEHATVEVDTFVVSLQAEDVLVLCSDGMWEMVRDDEIERIIASSNSHPSQISNMLIQAALIGGGADNISVIAVCVAKQNPT